MSADLHTEARNALARLAAVAAEAGRARDARRGPLPTAALARLLTVCEDALDDVSHAGGFLARPPGKAPGAAQGGRSPAPAEGAASRAGPRSPGRPGGAG